MLIARRELRVSVRGRAHFWFRFAVALFACLAAGLAMAGIDWSVATHEMGMHVMGSLAQAGSLACLAAGALLTADSISSEKRQGTLGILFLTHLKGSEVVLGKMASAWVGGFYGLLGLLPVMALPLFLGGVTAGDFLRVWVLLLCTLFAALAAGLLCSCAHRREQAAILQTAILLLVISHGLPMVKPELSWLSPSGMIPFALQGFEEDPARYGRVCLGLIVVGSVLLALAGGWAPRCWKERTVHPPLARYTLRPAQGILDMDEDTTAETGVGDVLPLERRARQNGPGCLLIWVSVGVGGGAW
jgi:hypothetical protein